MNSWCHRCRAARLMLMSYAACRSSALEAAITSRLRVLLTTKNLVWLQPQPAALQRAAAQHHLLMPAAARPQLASGPAAPAVGHKALAAKEARLLGGAPVGQVGHEVVEFPVGRRLRFGYVPQRLRPAGAPDLSLASCRGTHKGGQDVQIAAVDMKFLSCSSARCCALACINPFD